jgi:general secretion pathway protein J
MMVRTVFSDGQPTRVQVITYRVKDGMLTRRESVATRDLGELNALWLAAANDTDNSQAIVLQQGVSAMTMRLWSNSGKQWQEPDASAVQNAGSASTTQAQQSQQNQQTQTTSSGSAAAAAAAQQAAAAQTAFTGLELALQMQGTQDKMLKVFLLGAV